MRMAWWLFISLWVVPCFCTRGGGRVREFNWAVEYMFRSPDCVEKAVMGINGEFPGPTIRALAGDTLLVRLTNRLTTEGVVIHWHGIRQIGTPWADGTASISQCAIQPGDTFVYRFKVDKPGTFFYHAHYGMQRAAGLYGSLIVDVPEGAAEPFRYDGEFNLLLSDWWHQSALHQELQLSSVPFRWIHEPQTILINGRGQFNCSMAAHVGETWSLKPCALRGGEPCAPRPLRLRPNGTYRLRLASTTSLSSLNLRISKHKMVVVEADGNYVKPFTVEDLDIYSGETYSVLLTADQDPAANYWLSVSVRGRRPQTPPALTLLNYPPTPVSLLPAAPPPTHPLWNDYAHSKSFSRRIRAAPGTPAPPDGVAAHRRITLLNTQNTVGGLTRWAINNVSLSLPATPYLAALTLPLPLPGALLSREPPPDAYPVHYDVMRPPPNPNATLGDAVYVLRFNATVDVVLQNANALEENSSEIHPWHLHGHDFWVLGYGEGRFVGDGEAGRVNLKDPPLRNTVVVYPYGWTAVRFVADNPGAWAFHCHVEPHLHMGMGVVMVEGLRRVGKLPPEAVACGLAAAVVTRKHP